MTPHAHEIRRRTSPTSHRPWQKLHAVALAIEAAELREPYPRLALLMQSLAAPRTASRVTGHS